jgi:hypothetical protein
MPFSRRETIVAVALGILADALVIVLGLVVPAGDPSRDRVDNTLLILGLTGVLLTLMLPRSGMIAAGRPTRLALGVYGALSLVAVVLADFGPMRRVGWGVKLVAGALCALAVRGLARRA